MPSSRRLRLTDEARSDLSDLLQYTLETWGREQRDKYRALIWRRLRALVGFPHLGRARDELFSGCRSLVVEQHVAYYLVREREIVVARILHSRRDATAEVKEPS